VHSLALVQKSHDSMVFLCSNETPDRLPRDQCSLALVPVREATLPPPGHLSSTQGVVLRQWVFAKHDDTARLAREVDSGKERLSSQEDTGGISLKLIDKHLLVRGFLLYENLMSEVSSSLKFISCEVEFRPSCEENERTPLSCIQDANELVE
jgi:hypothetical protein